MEKRKLELEMKDGDEVIEREAKKFGNSGHIIVPEKHIGKNVKVICQGKFKLNKNVQDSRGEKWKIKE